MPIVVMDISIYVVLLSHLFCLALLTFHFGICTEIVCIPSEREALLRFKHHLKDPSNRLSSWNASNPNCCNWAGVVCSNVTTAHVLQLHLNTSRDSYESDEAYFNSMFGGEVSPSLLDLKHLNHLDLSHNAFGGMQIPSFLWEMTTLTYLNLSNAALDGRIPPQIGNLSNLLYLDLSYAANGTIPYQIGNLTNLLHLGLRSYNLKPLFAESLHWLSGLSRLQYLDLSCSNLSKSLDWLQTLQALPSLMELCLQGCVLPSEYNQPSSLNFSSLLTLDLSPDIVSSSPTISFVPKWIFGLRKLVSLQLSGNGIQGSIPDGIQNLTLVENLDLSDNSFSSSIPDWLYRLHHLKFLNLRRNNLRGTISDALGNLTSMKELGLSGNQLEGRIPTSLGNLCNLREIDFSYLKLNQQVNEILEILTPCVSHGLTWLQIESSQLSGNLTDQIEVFKNIVILDFSNNSIRGSLPRSFERLSSLGFLDLSKNQFNGNPFEVLRSLSELWYLSIEGNLFQGVVKDDDLANLTSLHWFHASGNNLTLEVGANWHPSFQLSELEMNSWQLGPNFPSWIQSQKNLGILDMSNTGISDSIPAWIWETFSHDYVIYLNLSRNHIHGELIASTLTKPTSIQVIDLSSNHLRGKLPYLSHDYLSWLDLSSNSFSGSMTDFLCKKQEESFLNFLNLASNNLSGEIPDCWRMWSNLVDVNLQSNHFVGNLPPSMGSLTELETLHIRNNSLSGAFPPILKKTNDLISLDLGENMLTGIIPTWVGKRLSKLKILRLRSNTFSSHIPKEICDMAFLQDLDLAINNFSGNIPNCFNHLDAMLLRNRSRDSFIHSNASSAGVTQSIVSSLLWVKGRGTEYKNILGLVTNVDLSDNNLSGEIPNEITILDGLIYLNLSKNHLSGQIPPSIGNMISLESLDFSRNHLSGEIPETISNISFLSQLDLSYNNLKGRIPTATQLQTFEAPGFVGNDLCGPPLPVNCSSIPNKDDNGKQRDGHGVNWFFVSMALGFIVGFWAVVAPLFMFRSWRHTYYGFLDDMWYKIQSCWRM